MSFLVLKVVAVSSDPSTPAGLGGVGRGQDELRIVQHVCKMSGRTGNNDGQNGWSLLSQKFVEVFLNGFVGL